jgi:serine/threonine protein kinase
LTLWAESGTLTAMAAHASPLGAAPVASKKRATWTPQEIPKVAPKNYVGAYFSERYLLRRRIGAGGMSTVYEAQDSTLGKRVVVKILRDDLPSDPVDRFRREAHVLAGLTHEHIAQIFDRQDPDNEPRFLVTEYIDGQDLGELLGRGPMPAPVVLAIGVQVCAALAYAHDAGVIHRDVKPSNLMLARHPSGDIFVKVIDFGIAKLMQDSELAAPGRAPAGARRETLGNIVLGTAPFWCGEEGPQADVYALALTLAVLLTGKIPPVGVKVDLSGDTIPRNLASVLETALALDGEIATMDALDAALCEVRDSLDPRVAEGERRRYVAEIFGKSKVAAASKAEAAAPSSASPRFAERFILCEELGRGGMGRVRVAFDTELRRRVALKTIHPQHLERASSKARFLREARALAAIDHPGVPKLLEIGSQPEPFITMDLVVGVPLKAEKRIEPLRALSLAIDLGEILVAAHEVGVVHRDVKPDNLVIGKGDRVRLLDFGLCLLMPRYHRRELLFPATPPGERYETGAMELNGTPGYTAPEIQAREGTSPRSDVYSVCAVLYRMLTGRSLLDGATSTTRPIRRGEFPAALGGVAELLRRGTAREPSDRPRSMADLVAELEVLRSGLLRARQRRLLALAVAITALGCLGLATIVALGLSSSNPGAAPAAPRDEPAAPVSAAVTPVCDEPAPATNPTPSEPAAPVTPAAEPAASEAPTADDAPVPPPPPNLRPRPVVPITEATVAELVQKGRRKFDECLGSYHQLRLVVASSAKRPDGRATLTEVDGMPYAASVPDHDCLRKGLRRLSFPRPSKPTEFVVPLDLRPAEGTPG